MPDISHNKVHFTGHKNRELSYKFLYKDALISPHAALIYSLIANDKAWPTYKKMKRKKKMRAMAHQQHALKNTAISKGYIHNHCMSDAINNY